jgi:ABC-type transporter Mla subunit MlaD
MAERRMRLRLGLFVATTLTALAGLVVLFGKAPDLFSNTVGYTILFPEAPGISPGTPIRKSGVRIGEVTKLDLDPETGQVRVLIAIDPKYPPRTSEEATITRGLLSGDTAIDFLPKLGADGQPLPRGEAYPPGSVISGVPPITPRSILTPASGVLASAQQSLDRMVVSFERLEKVAPKLELALEEIASLARDVRLFIPEIKKTNDRIQNLIGEVGPDPAPELVAAQRQPPQPGQPPIVVQPPVVVQDQTNLRTLVREIQELVRTIRPAVDDIRGSLARLEPELTGTARSARQTFDRAAVTFDSLNDVLSPENRKQLAELLRNLNTIGGNIIKLSAGFQNLLDEAEKSVKNFDARSGGVLEDVRAITRPLAQRSETIVRNVTESAEQLNKVLTEIREVMRTFAREDGTVQKLLTDPSLFHNLDAASVALAKVLLRAEKIARDLEVFADKVARRPELIGVGGALKPSSGLKESPTAPYPSYRPDWPPAIPARPVAPEWLGPEDPARSKPAPVQGYPPR